MSKFFSAKYAALTPYVPGEQPKDAQYVKLNTNESPFLPPASVVEAARIEAGKLHLYSDPESTKLTEKAVEVLGVKKGQVLMTNGSDEALNFAFMAFCDENNPIVFPDITYGFYPVFAELNHIPYETIALEEDFSIDYRKYVGIGKNIVIANPNAPTGLALSRDEIEEIVKSNPNHVVIIDEAYVDFGGESCVSLIDQYDNLLVTQTFSKSRSLAGGRLGMAIGNEKLIADLNTIKYSTNPYNVNSMTLAAGLGTMEDEAYTKINCQTVQKNRDFLANELAKMGFEQTPSLANFIFAKHPKIDGGELYARLRERGILVRHFTKEKISQYNRITVGSREQMTELISAISEILEERK